MRSGLTVAGLLPALAARAFVATAAVEPWIEFPVEPQKVYSVDCELTPDSAAGEAVLRFFDQDGRDIAVTERSLGFVESVARKSFAAGASAFTLSCRAGSGSGLRPVRGVVRVERGGPAKVLACRSYEGEPLDGEDGSAGFETSLSGTGNFAPNLAPNGSFECLSGNGEPEGWRWTGPGKGELTSRSYAGRRALRLTAASEGGRWETAPIPLAGTNAVQILYAVKFSRYARPCGHLDPVRVEYLRKASDGGWAKVAEPSLVPRMEFSYAAYARFYGEWFPVLTRRHPVPPGATAIRIFCEHRDRRVDGLGGAASWGDILVDNVAVYQAAPSAVPPQFVRFVYAPLHFGCGQLPPQLPVGRRRENSVSFAQGIQDDGSIFFADENGHPEMNVLVGDLAGYARKLEVRGRVVDIGGRTVSSFVQPVRLVPFAASKVRLQPECPKKFGTYEAQCDIFEGAAKVGQGVARFAWAANRSRRPQSERDRDDYPFDMHLGAAFNFNWKEAPEIVELQAHLCDMLGVRGVRVQALYPSFRPDQSPEDAAAAAKRMTADFRVVKEPALRRYGLRWWPSLMEQGRNNLPHTPRTEREFAAWRAWHRGFAESLKGDADFVLYGNEGLGGYTAHLGPDDSLSGLSDFDGSTRHWWRCCKAALEGLKEGDANLRCGLAHASDETGAIARLFRSSPEGNFPIDCWGVNSYVNPEVIAAAVIRELGSNVVAKTFGVIPEIGHGAYKPGDYVLCARRIPEIYLMVKADAPWVKRIAWFILGEFNEYGVFDDAFAPRPAAVSYLTMTDILGAGSVERCLRLPDGGRFFVWRKADGTAVGAGWSPQGLSVPLTVKGRNVRRFDLFGNPSPIDVTDGETVLRLGCEMTYVARADDMAVAKTLTAAARISSDGRAIEFVVRNERRVASRLTVVPSAHPLVRLEAEPEQRIVLGPGEKRKFSYPFAAFRTSDGRRQKVTFAVCEETGVKSECSVEVSGRAMQSLPSNLIVNPGLDEWSAEDRPSGWSVRRIPGPSGKLPEKSETRRCDDDGFRSSPSAAIWVKGIAPMLWARIEYVQDVPLKPNTRYYFSAAKRLVASGNWPFPLVTLRGGRKNPKDETILTKVAELPDSAAVRRGWTRCEAVFETGAEGPFAANCILRMQNIGYGEVRYDDIELFELGQR